MAVESEKILLQTPRLYITFFNPDIPSHSSFLVKLWNDPLFIELNGKTGVDTPEIAEGVIRRAFLKEYERNGYSVFVVLLKPSATSSVEECEAIGTTSLRIGGDADSVTEPDIGFAMVGDRTGKGYATEATEALLLHARKELGIGGAFGFTGPDNMASRRVLEKLGFEDRGVRKLPQFGGKSTQVYMLPDMAQDLSVYNLRVEE
jgi:RimJ/RimL family protein N-acetyltransferase